MKCGDEFFIVLGFPLLRQNDDRTVKSQSLKLATALPQLEEPNTQRDVRVIKSMQGIHHKHGFSFQRDTRKGIKQTIARGGAHRVQVSQSLFDLHRMPSKEARQGEGGEPLIARNDKERTTQDQAGDQLARIVQVTLSTGTLDYEAEQVGSYREESIWLELDRRRAKTPEERALVPAPPGSGAITASPTSLVFGGILLASLSRLRRGRKKNARR